MRFWSAWFSISSSPGLKYKGGYIQIYRAPRSGQTRVTPTKLNLRDLPPSPSQSDKKELSKLEKVVKKSHRTLFQTKTNFPFDLFPDELSIDENQVNIVHKRFFYTQDIESVLISEIKEVSISTSLVFSSLTISVLRPNSIPIKLDFLWPQDAEMARSLIQGLTAIQKENIDLSKIDAKTLKNRLLNIGRETN